MRYELQGRCLGDIQLTGMFTMTTRECTHLKLVDPICSGWDVLWSRVSIWARGTTLTCMNMLGTSFNVGPTPCLGEKRASKTVSTTSSRPDESWEELPRSRRATLFPRSTPKPPPIPAWSSVPMSPTLLLVLDLTRLLPLPPSLCLLALILPSTGLIFERSSFSAPCRLLRSLSCQPRSCPHERT